MADVNSKATPRVLDFTNVKERSAVNPVHVEEGDYKLKILSVSEEKAKSGNLNWLFILQLDGRANATYPYYCGLDEAQLWKIRNLYVACGTQVPKKKIRVDPNKLVGKFVGATLTDDEYEGKMKSVISSVFPASDLPDDKPAKKTTRRKTAAQDDDVDEVEEIDEEEIEEVEDEVDVEDL